MDTMLKARLAQLIGADSVETRMGLNHIVVVIEIGYEYVATQIDGNDMNDSASSVKALDRLRSIAKNLRDKVDAKNQWQTLKASEDMMMYQDVVETITTKVASSMMLPREMLTNVDLPPKPANRFEAIVAELKDS